MALTIYNTLTRKKEEFKPIEPGKIRMYVCGMTVYDYCHLGHARVLVAFDVITRYLRARRFEVTYVRNITDIDDKILKRAAEHPELYKTYTDLTDKFIREMHVDEEKLGIKRPDKEPRATQHIGDIITLIEKLIANEYAYHASNGDVYYAVDKFVGYGKLSGKKPEELLAGARVEVDEAKRDPRDFALWKSAQGSEAGWPSPWGWGRPGWHIECSAMSGSCLGETFDIHGGGPDLKFPHHENEIAQSEAATGKHYVNYWMHAGAVRVDGEKMSKSLGNFFTIREVLKKVDEDADKILGAEARGDTSIAAQLIRFLFLSTHYRSPIDYSQESLKDSGEALRRFNYLLQDFDDVQPADLEAIGDNRHFKKFVAAMDDDFNTPLALGVMYELASDINSSVDKLEKKRELVSVLRAMGHVFGILPPKTAKVFLKGFSVKALTGSLSFQGFPPEVVGSMGAVESGQDGFFATDQIDSLIQERIEAKKAKNFARADEIRKQLLAQGIVLEDRKDGTTDWRRE